jgi:hypothetical protein
MGVAAVPRRIRRTRVREAPRVDEHLTGDRGRRLVSLEKPYLVRVGLGVEVAGDDRGKVPIAFLGDECGESCHLTAPQR